MSDLSLKICMVGNMRSGKTGLCARFTRDIFSIDEPPTYSVDIPAVRQLSTPEIKRSVTLKIFDMSGNEQFRDLVVANFNKARAFVLCVDLSEEVLDRQAIKLWVNLVRASVKDASIILVGTKSDLLVTSQKKTDKQKELENIVSEFQPPLSGCCITSAKNGDGVSLVFSKILELDEIKKFLMSIKAQPIRAMGHPSKPRSKFWCCCAEKQPKPDQELLVVSEGDKESEQQRYRETERCIVS